MAVVQFPGSNGKIGFTRAGDIWTIDPVGTGAANLTNTSAAEYCPLWAPGGAKIAFVRSGFNVMNPDGTGQLKVNPAGHDEYVGCPEDWSPDATQIAYAVDDHCDVGGLWSVRADGSGVALHLCIGPPTCPFEDGGFWGPREPDFSPDGRKLAMRSCDPLFPYDLWTLGLDGSGYTRVATNVAYDTEPDFSPSGGQIAFSGVRMVNVDGTNLHALHPGAAPAWSPDGEKVGFALSEDVWTVDPDGSDAINLTSTGGVDFPFFWSPDAEKIVFSSNRTGDYDVYVMNRDGNGLVNITNTPGVDEKVFGWQGMQKGYPRPKGASPMQVSLVPAYAPCTAPTPPMAHRSVLVLHAAPARLRPPHDRHPRREWPSCTHERRDQAEGHH